MKSLVHIQAITLIFIVEFVNLLGAIHSRESCLQDDIRLYISYMVILLENSYSLPKFATSCYWLN